MRDWADRAFNEIDAGLFSGDEFHNEESLNEFEEYMAEYMARWRRQIASIRQLLREEKQSPNLVIERCPKCEAPRDHHNLKNKSICHCCRHEFDEENSE